MSKSSIREAFVDKLRDPDITLDDRLSIAYGALVSQDFPVNGKEQIVFDWLPECLEANEKNTKALLKSLQKCLSSDWLAAMNDALDASKLIETLHNMSESKKNKYNKTLLCSLLLLVKNYGFRRHCRFDVQPYIQALLLALDLVQLSPSKEAEDSNSEIDSLLEELLDSVYTIFKSTQQRDELKKHLINDVFPKLLPFSYMYNFQQSPKFQILLEEVVVGNEMGVLVQMFKINSKGRTPSHLKSLLNLLNLDKTELSTMLCPLLLDTCIKSRAKKPASDPDVNSISLFYAMLSYTGFKLQLPYETLDSSYDTWLKLKMLKGLVNILHENNISTLTESEEGLLSDNLLSIIKQLFSEEYTLTPELLTALQSIFKFYPESVRISFRPFFKNVIFQRKDSSEVTEAYDCLLMDVVKIFWDLNKVEKFFHLFFEDAVLLVKGGSGKKITKHMILTNGFHLILSEKLPSLTGNQLKTILIHLEKIVSTELIPQVENSTFVDGAFGTLLKLWVDVLCRILENSYLVLSTRWNIISPEMIKLVTAVQTFGCEITKSSELVFLQEFLRLVKVFADLETLMTRYVVSLSSMTLLPHVKSKDKKMNNLAKSHGFLSSSEWNRIGDHVMESCDSELKNCWFDLLVQKYHSRNDEELITFLVLSPGSDWLWQNITSLSENIPLKHLDLYTERLLTDCSFHEDFSQQFLKLQSIGVMSNRNLRLALILQALKQMSKTLPNKHALSRQMIKLTDVLSVIRREAVATSSMIVEVMEEGDLIVTSEALSEAMNKCSWDTDSEMEITEDAVQQIVRYLSIVTSMNVYGFNNITKKTICLTLMGLSYDLKKEKVLLHSLLDIITGCLDEGNSVIADSLDRRVLLKWLSLVHAGYPLADSLSRLSVLKVIQSLDQGVEGMSQLLQADQVLLTSLLEAMVQVHGNKAFKDKKEFVKLVKKLVEMSSFIVTKKSKAKYLRLYTVSIQAELLYLQKNSSPLLNFLQDYLEVLFKRFADNSVESNATELVDFVLNEKSGVDQAIKDFVYRSMTEELCKTESCVMLNYPATVKNFFEVIALKQFEDVLNAVYKSQSECLISSRDKFSVNECYKLWDLVMTAQVDKEKATCRQKLLTQVMSDCLSLLVVDPSQIDANITRLIHSVSASRSIVMNGKLLDLIFVTLGLVPTDNQPQLLPECLSALNCLLTHRAQLVFDRVPAHNQRLRKFLTSLVQCASVDDKRSIDYSLATSSVNQVTRIVKTIVDQCAKHFARIAPYLIADFLHLLVNHTVEISIKHELENCVCLLLTICDNHSKQQLQNLLSLASTELFKTLSAQKSYKYTGKV